MRRVQAPSQLDGGHSISQHKTALDAVVSGDTSDDEREERGIATGAWASGWCFGEYGGVDVSQDCTDHVGAR